MNSTTLSPRLNLSGRKNILSIYLTAGFPRLDDTIPLCIELERSGVQMIEIGFPFSDPMADGPVIQQSSEKALKNGMNLPLLFNQLKEIRKSVSIPLILMGYLNPALQYGFEKFCRSCADVGVDGLILPDLPVDDFISHYRKTVHEHGLHNIFLIDQNTPDDRLRLLDRHSTSFLYAVSTPSTTGGAISVDASRKAYFERLRGAGLEHPFIIGFGIANREAFKASCEYASGAIVGSAFIKELEKHMDPLPKVRGFIATFL